MEVKNHIESEKIKIKNHKESEKTDSSDKNTSSNTNKHNMKKYFREKESRNFYHFIWWTGRWEAIRTLLSKWHPRNIYFPVSKKIIRLMGHQSGAAEDVCYMCIIKQNIKWITIIHKLNAFPPFPCLYSQPLDLIQAFLTQPFFGHSPILIMSVFPSLSPIRGNGLVNFTPTIGRMRSDKTPIIH